MILFLLIMLVLVLLPDWAIWHAYVSPHASLLWSVLWWVPTLLLLASMFAFMHGWGHDVPLRLLFGLLLLVAFPKLLFILTAWLLGWKVSLGLSALLFLAFLYGSTRGYKQLTIRQETFASEALPRGFDGYRIVQLSDLHLGTYGHDASFVRRLVDEVNAQHPDLIVFTGDLVNVDGDEPAPFVEELGRLRVRDGVYSVMGNHDYIMFNRSLSPADIRGQIMRLQDYQRRMGWRLLLNEHVTLHRDGDSIALIGVENTGRGFISVGDLPRAMQGVPSEAFKVLLSHDPTHWRMEVVPRTDIQLTLSGHTHAAQLRLGRFSPSAWVYKEWLGWYREGRQSLYVSAGVGGSVPFRLGAWPEINVITLKRQYVH